MKTILTRLILLTIKLPSAQHPINNKGNRNQIYPKVEGLDHEIKQLANLVYIPNLEASICWMQEIGIRAAKTLVALQTQNWLVDNLKALDVVIHQFPDMEEILDAENVIAV